MLKRFADLEPDFIVKLYERVCDVIRVSEISASGVASHLAA